MSEAKFKDAKGNLAFSQQLMDSIRASQQPQMAPEQPQEAPQQAPEAPQEAPQAPVTINVAPQEEKKEIGMLTAFMDEVRNLFKTKEDDEKKTQGMVDKHIKEVESIKQGLKDILDEDDKQS